LVLAGSSLGGTVAVLTAASLPVDGLVTVASPARLPLQPRAEWGGSGAEANGRVQVGNDEWISSELFADAARHDVLRAARQVTCRWLVIHAANDDVVRLSNGASLAAAGQATRFVVHPSAGHRFHEPADRQWLVRQVIAFIRHCGV
jgi:pimeloyl-ACP methyl ester carboxylesterase